MAERDAYHHGDLRRALVQAGLDLAQDGGPAAIVLREATRRVGVAPNAAYRHFANRDALFEAVRGAALAKLAQRIKDHMQSAQALGDAASRARSLLAAVGRAYLQFAQEEPGWFRTAFASVPFSVHTPVPVAGAAPAAASPTQGLNPFELLNYALDEMVAAGVLSAERRPGAEFLAWSTVHGMAMLCIDGPLRTATPAQRAALGARLLAMVEKGI